MKKILLTSFAIVALLSSCKKTETKPSYEQATVTVYHKLSNFSVNLNGLKSYQQKTVTETIDVIDETQIVYAKNNVKLANDSIHITVTYKGKTKTAGAKINSLWVEVGNWRFQNW